MSRSNPIRLDRQGHRSLYQIARTFPTNNHCHFLTEALIAIRRAPQEPLAGLELLAAMRGTTHAGSQGQARALADVSHWLARHIAGHFSRAKRDGGWEQLSEVIATELGWLRRLAKVDTGKTESRVGHHPKRVTNPRFDNQLNTLREQWLKRDAKGPTSRPPPPSPPITAWRAGFADFLGAREGWKIARKRLDRGSPAKDKRIALAIREPEPPAGVAFEASFALTAGLVELWRAIDTSSGQARDFHVVEWDEAQTPWLATRVEFEP